MPSTPTEQEFKTRVLLLLGKKRNKTETKWNLSSKAGWHVPAPTRQKYLDDLVKDGLIIYFQIHKMGQTGRPPNYYRLTEKGNAEYREAAKTYRRGVPKKVL